ncbi:hypothetical protein Golax_000720 [Gossypium laxum]|uniref:Uncharacterized protein n=1 Tax=Gossypium laxum TaxID=34288 RepID=A0A7J9AUT3_9ROSI|nr:hypothetical protein [Gossypium laxum]
MYKKSLHAIGELVRKVIRIDYKMDSASCSHFANMEIYVDMRHRLVSKIQIDGQLQIIEVEEDFGLWMVMERRQMSRISNNIGSFMIGGNLVNNEGRGKANKRGNTSIGARLGPSSVNNGSSSSQALRLVGLVLDENVNPNIIRTSECSNDGVLSPASLQPSSTTVVKWKEVKKDVRSRKV